MRVIVNKNPKKLELINPASGLWAIRWNIESLDETNDICSLQNFNHKPTLKEIKDTIVSEANKECSAGITEGFVWNNYPVYLNSENLNNFTIISKAVKDDPSLLPVTLKFGASDYTEYYTFNTLEELDSFYSAMGKHITSCLSKCWEIKSNINLEEYK